MVHSTTTSTQRSSWNMAANTMKEGALVAVDPDHLATASHVAKLFRYYTKAIIPGVKEVEGFRFASVLYTPLAIQSIVTSAQEIYRKAPEKMDNALTIVSEVGALADICALVADALDTFEWIPDASVWVDPLYIVGATLSTAGIVLNTKSAYETHAFGKELNEKMTLSKEEKEAITKINKRLQELNGKAMSKSMLSDQEKSDLKIIGSKFEHGVKLIKEKHGKNVKFVKKHFETDGDQLTGRLDEISRYAIRKLDSPLPHKVQEGQDDINSAKTLLNKRLSSKKWSNAFKILTAIISLIGFGLLFSPVAPVGLVLLGLSGTMSICHRLYKRRQTQKFEAAIQDVGINIRQTRKPLKIQKKTNSMLPLPSAGG